MSRPPFLISNRKGTELWPRAIQTPTVTRVNVTAGNSANAEAGREVVRAAAANDPDKLKAMLGRLTELYGGRLSESAGADVKDVIAVVQRALGSARQAFLNMRAGSDLGVLNFVQRVQNVGPGVRLRYVRNGPQEFEYIDIDVEQLLPAVFVPPQRIPIYLWGDWFVFTIAWGEDASLIDPLVRIKSQMGYSGWSGFIAREEDYLAYSPGKTEQWVKWLGGYVIGRDTDGDKPPWEDGTRGRTGETRTFWIDLKPLKALVVPRLTVELWGSVYAWHEYPANTVIMKGGFVGDKGERPTTGGNAYARADVERRVPPASVGSNEGLELDFLNGPYWGYLYPYNDPEFNPNSYGDVWYRVQHKYDFDLDLRTKTLKIKKVMGAFKLMSDLGIKPFTDVNLFP